MSQHSALLDRPVAIVRPLDPPHRHLAGCFWDVQRCRWQCSPRQPSFTAGPR